MSNHKAWSSIKAYKTKTKKIYSNNQMNQELQVAQVTYKVIKIIISNNLTRVMIQQIGMTLKMRIVSQILILVCVRRGTSTYLRIRLNIRGSGRGHLDMGMGRRFGKMELNMREIGRTIKLMGKGLFCMYTEISMKDPGKKIRHMGRVHILIVMGLHM